jgi:integrase
MRGNVWHAIIDLPRATDGTRRQKEVSLKTASKREAEKRLTDLVKQVRDGMFVDAHACTLGEHLTAYNRDVSRLKLAERSHAREAEIIRNQIVPHIGHIHLASLQPRHVQELYTKLLDGGARNGKPLSPRSVEYVHAVIHVALKHAVRTRLLAYNPADRVEKPKPRRSEMKTLTLDELGKLLAPLRGTNNYVPMLIAATCGLRAGEILALRWADVDFARGTLTVQRSLTQVGSNVTVKEPKTAAGRRTIPLPNFVVQDLKNHKAQADELKQMTGCAYNPEGLLCPGQDGSYRKPKTFAGVVRDAIRRAGFNVRFHDLRHTHASILASQGASFKVIQERLGHTNLSTTMNIYLHNAPNLQEEATKKFGEEFEKISGTDLAEDLVPTSANR